MKRRRVKIEENALAYLIANEDRDDLYWQIGRFAPESGGPCASRLAESVGIEFATCSVAAAQERRHRRPQKLPDASFVHWGKTRFDGACTPPIKPALCRDAEGGESCHLQDYPSKKSNATNRR